MPNEGSSAACVLATDMLSPAASIAIVLPPSLAKACREQEKAVNFHRFGSISAEICSTDLCEDSSAAANVENVPPAEPFRAVLQFLLT